MKALVVHPGGFGDVLLAGPAVRALATRAGRVTMLCASRGACAARLLPHVGDVLVWDTPGADRTGPPATAPPGPGPRTGPPPPAHRAPDGSDFTGLDPDGLDTARLLRRLRQEAYDVALVLAPELPHPWPTARLLRSARVRRVGSGAGITGIGGIARPGTGPGRDALHAAVALGFGLRAGDDGGLRVRPVPDTAALTGNGPYVAVHPGAGDPARAWAAAHGAEIVTRLCDAGHRVVVTGGPDEAALTRAVSGAAAVDLGARTGPRVFAGVLRSADLLVTAATGAAHLAEAVGTPVVGPDRSRADAEEVVRAVAEAPATAR